MRSAIAIGCAVGLIDGPLAGVWNGAAPEVAGVGRLLSGLSVGIVTALGAGLGAGFVYWRATQSGRISVVEAFRWSWRDARKWVAIGPAVGASLGLIYGTADWAARGEFRGLIYGLTIGVCNGLVGGLLAGVMVGIGRGEISKRTSPNQGIRRSAYTALLVGCLAWLAVGLAAAGNDFLALLTTYEIRTNIPSEVMRHILIWNVINWLVWALSFGLGAGMLNGGMACLQHGIVRCMFWRAGVMPWNYARFLNHAVERILLHKVGGGYQFKHRLLQEYFANLPDRARR